jgi:hypothetical protein
MRRLRFFLAVGIGLWVGGVGWFHRVHDVAAQSPQQPIFGCQQPTPMVPFDPNCRQPSPYYFNPSDPGGSMQPGQGGQPGDSSQPSTPPTGTAFGEQGAAGTPTGVGNTPGMFGYALAPSARITTVVRTGSITTPTTKVTTILVPAANSGGFVITDNESPRPTDRVFATYNYFNDVSTGAGGERFDLHREMVGFEKTFLDGTCSIGMRLPYLELEGLHGEGIANSLLGDLSVIFKWAFLNDLVTGNVISAGIVATFPTGNDVALLNGTNLHDTFLQPYVGGIYNMGDWYLQGFSSIGVPTDSRDVTFLSNDFAVGYWWAKSDTGLIRGIVPTLEGHLFTPLNHRNPNGEVYAPDLLDVTGGVSFIFSKGTSLGLAVGTPLTGPRPFDLEAIVNFNLRF